MLKKGSAALEVLRVDVFKKVAKKVSVPRPYHRVNAIANAGTLNAALNNAGQFKFFQVLRYGGLRQTQLTHQCAGHAGIGA